MEGELGKVDNFNEQLSQELKEFRTKIIVPLQGLVFDDPREFDLVLDADRTQEAWRIIPGGDDTEHQTLVYEDAPCFT